MRAAIAGAFGITLLAAHGATSAMAEDDDDDMPFEQRVIRDFLGGMGVNVGKPGVEYRERSPLVVPPGRDLPPPQAAAAAAGDPNWPKDADVRDREKRKKKANRPARDEIYEQSRPLRPDELRGSASTASRVTPGTPAGMNEIQANRPLTPKELGEKGNIFSALWNKVAPSNEVEEFKGEPTRGSLTEPPSGYRTPSPSQPYGIVTKGKIKNKPMNVMDKGLE